MEVTMRDGSVFAFPNESWERAFLIKYGGEEEETLENFREVTEGHWNARTRPTKFGFDENWEREYEDHADLGAKVMYVGIRAALMGLILSEAGGAGVVALGPDGMTVYGKDGKRKIEDLGDLEEDT